MSNKHPTRFSAAARTGVALVLAAMLAACASDKPKPAELPANVALLFERVEGFTMPVLVNAFGSAERTSWALGIERLDELGVEHGGIKKAHYGSAISFRDPDGIALEFFIAPGT